MKGYWGVLDDIDKIVQRIIEPQVGVGIVQVFRFIPLVPPRDLYLTWLYVCNELDLDIYACAIAKIHTISLH